MVFVAAAMVIAAGVGLAVDLTGGGHRPVSGSEASRRWDAATRQRVAAVHDQAMALINRAQFAEARSVLEKHLQQIEGDAEGYMLLSQALVGQGRLAAAYDAASRASELTGSGEAHLAAGQFAQVLDRHDAALTHFRHAVERDPNHVQYRLYLANMLTALHRFDEAAEHARRVLSANPQISRAHYVLGEAAIARGEREQAIEHLDRAIDRVEPNSRKHLTYKITRAKWLRRGDTRDKLRAVETLTSLPPAMLASNRLVTEELAITFDMLGKAERSASLWEQWCESHPDDAAAAAQAGLYWLRANDPPRAAQHLDRARRLKPHHPLVQQLTEQITASR